MLRLWSEPLGPVCQSQKSDKALVLCEALLVVELYFWWKKVLCPTHGCPSERGVDQLNYEFEEWYEVARPFYQVLPQEPKADAGVQLKAKATEELLITQLKSPAQVLVHDPAIQKGVCHEYLLFERFLIGGGWGEVGDVAFKVMPERLHLIDMSKRYVSRKQRSESRGVLIPHAAVGYVPGKDPVYSFVEVSSAAGRILAVAHEVLLSASDEAPDSSRLAITRAFLDLICRLMLGRQPDGAPSTAGEQTLELCAREYIMSHLASHELGVQSLSRAFGVSRATVYRQFADEGGIGRYIRNRRLDRCFFELAGRKPSRGCIKAVSERWNFHDPSHFNRLFKARFGMSPSDCMATTAPSRALPTVDLTHLGRTWLDQIRRG